MSGVKNVLTSCLADAGNTGFGSCFTDIGMPRGLLFVAKNKVYSTADIADLKAAIEADILNDVPSNRLYPLGNIVNITDNTEAPVIQTFNTGAKAVVRNGFYDITLQWEAGGFCVLYALLKANGQNKQFFIYTDKGLLIGTDAGTADEPEQFKGINPNLVYAFPFKFSDGTKVTEYSLNVNFAPEQINQNIAFVDFNDDGGLAYLAGLSGLQNVTLSQLAAPTPTVVKIGAKTACGTVDLHDEFATELAVAGAWVVKRKDTGAVITVSAVANDTVDGGWSLTLTSAAGLDVLVSLAGPTELDALDVSGYESNKLLQTIPAS